MKKIIFLCAALFCTQFAFSEEEVSLKQTSTYTSLGGGILNTFTVNLGKRMQTDHTGIDLGIGGSTFIVFPSEIYGYCNYLYYPKPDPKSQFYYGLGVKGAYGLLLAQWQGGVPLSGFRVEPHLIFGKEYQIEGQKRRFLQGNIGALYISDKGTKLCPIVTVTYGFIF